jgi:hypothetical protein
MILAGLRGESGLEQKRDYLGMSRVHMCPRLLYDEFNRGLTRNEMGDWNHWMCLVGYTHQNMLTRLVLEGQALAEHEFSNMSIICEHEIMADFDSRFRGHVDMLFGDIPVEFKSVSWRNYQEILESGRMPRHHFGQMQLYLHHGGFENGLMVYVARDCPAPLREDGREVPVWVFDVYSYPDIARKLDYRAKLVLDAVDEGEPPQCWCGKCLHDVDERVMAGWPRPGGVR